MSSEEPADAPGRALPDAEHTGPLAPPDPGSDDAAVDGVDEFLGRPVALVSLPPATGEELAARVEQVRQLARLHHPGLPEVFDVDGLAEDTESTLVLESLPGEPLADLLERGPLPARRVADLGVQLGSALAHAHAHGVRHGAIGPASVLVDDAGAARLVGLTARLRPEGAPGPDDPVAPDDDVRALARTLAAALDPADPAAARVTEALAAFDSDADTHADAAAGRTPDALVDRLGALAPGDDEPDRSEAAAWAAAGTVGAGGLTAVAGPDPVTTTTTAGASTVALGPAARAGTPGAPGARATTPPPTSRTPRRTGAAVLAAAVASLALASGVVLWNGVGFDRVEGAQVPPPPAVAAPIVPSAAAPITTSSGDGDGGTRAARETERDTTARRSTARETTRATRTTEPAPLPAPPVAPRRSTTTPPPPSTTTPTTTTTTPPTTTTEPPTTTPESTTTTTTAAERAGPSALASGS